MAKCISMCFIILITIINNEKYFYGYEYIDYMTIFNNCEDYFLLSTYDPDADTAAYLVDKDFKLHKFISNGEWDYDTYAEIQSEM